ncbi:MAG: DUF5658 family protein [Candidatus Bathyarchaeales archaeon]
MAVEKGEGSMLKGWRVPCLSLILMGSMDWLTTIVGITYFGAVESNPFLAEITRTSLPAFTAIKLSTTVIVGLLFHNAEKMLLKAQDKSSRKFQFTRLTLRSAYLIATLLLLTAVVNNLIVVASASK